MNPMLNSYMKIVDNISEWVSKTISFTIIVATVQITVEVILRYFFGAPTIWGLEVTLWSCAIIYTIGGVYSSLSDGHVRVDVFYMHWSPKTKAIMDIITIPIFFLGVGSLALAGSRWTWEAYVNKVTSNSTWEPLIWPIRFLIPLSSFLLIFEGINKLIRDILTLLKLGSDKGGAS